MSDCCSVNSAKTAWPVVMPCPMSGSRSKRVDILTVKSLVRHLPFGIPPTQFYFCDDAACEVVYFPSNPEAPTFRRADLLVKVSAKDPGETDPVCYCFGITPKSIREEIRRTGRSVAAVRIRAEVKAGNCACEVKNPSGKCCLGDVIRAAQEGMRALKSSELASSVSGNRAPTT